MLLTAKRAFSLSLYYTVHFSKKLWILVLVFGHFFHFLVQIHLNELGDNISSFELMKVVNLFQIQSTLYMFLL